MKKSKIFMAAGVLLLTAYSSKKFSAATAKYKHAGLIVYTLFSNAFYSNLTAGLGSGQTAKIITRFGVRTLLTVGLTTKLHYIND